MPHTLHKAVEYALETTLCCRGSAWLRCAVQRGGSRLAVRRCGRALLNTSAELVTEPPQKKQKQQQQQKQQQKGGGKKGEAKTITPKSEDFSRCE